MKNDDETPFKLHLFICTNHKGDNNCAQKGSAELRSELKSWAKQKFGKTIRINASGCLGKCSQGIVAVTYPHNKWNFQVNKTDFDRLKQQVESLLQE